MERRASSRAAAPRHRFPLIYIDGNTYSRHPVFLEPLPSSEEEEEEEEEEAAAAAIS